MVMNTALKEWQARLSLHFATLRDSRRARGTTEPLFGLEHGLSQTEVQDLERAVRAHIAYRPPSREKWLRKSEQGDKWNRCLIEGMIVLSETGARDEQTTPP